MGRENDRLVAGTICERDLSRIREAVCIQVEKIYDACREKDCIENARVRFECLTERQRDAINNAFNVKIRRAVVRDVITDVEPVPFRRGFYTVDVKFLIKVILDFFVRNGEGVNIETIPGEITFDKRVILFGSEGDVKIFKTHFVECGLDERVKSKLQQDNLPISKVEVAEPIPLSAKIRGILDKLFEERGDGEAENTEEERGLLTKRVYATIGLFSIIKLARFVQLLVPAFDFCYPDKECISSTEENPCELFETIEFPYNEFFPPQINEFPGALEQERAMYAETEEHHHREQT